MEILSYIFLQNLTDYYLLTTFKGHYKNVITILSKNKDDESPESEDQQTR